MRCKDCSRVRCYLTSASILWRCERQEISRWLGISDLIAEPEGPTFISYKVARCRLDRLRFVTQDPNRKSTLGTAFQENSPRRSLRTKPTRTGGINIFTRCSKRNLSFLDWKYSVVPVLARSLSSSRPLE
jgi:hypothetical protein